MPSDRHPARRRWPGALDAAGRRLSDQQKRAVRPGQQRRDRRRVPRLGCRGGGPLGGRLRRLQRAAHLGRRRRCGCRVRRDTRRCGHPRAGEEAAGRRHFHRPESACAAGIVGSYRRRHPVHRRPHHAQESRDGPGRARCGDRDRRTGRSGPTVGAAAATQLASPDCPVLPSFAGTPQRAATRPASSPGGLAGGRGRHVARRCGCDRDAAALARHRRDVLRRRLQPDHRPGRAEGRLPRQLLPVLRDDGSTVRLVPRRCCRKWRR